MQASPHAVAIRIDLIRICHRRAVVGGVDDSVVVFVATRFAGEWDTRLQERNVSDWYGRKGQNNTSNPVAREGLHWPADELIAALQQLMDATRRSVDQRPLKLVTARRLCGDIELSEEDSSQEFIP